MKLTLFLIPAFLLVNFRSKAQITIEQYNHPCPPSEIINLQINIGANDSAPAAGPNMFWNYSPLFDSAYSTSTACMPPTNPLFSKATRYYNGPVPFLSDTLIIKQYQLNDTNGYSDYGLSVDSQYFDISAYTTHKGDFLSFPAQNQFTQGYYILKYPLSFNSSWSCQTKSALNFKLSVNTLIYTAQNAPGQRVRRTVQKDTVVGWGKMIIPFNNNGSYFGSEPYNVLMIKETATNSDSFYINDSPASPILLFGLHLSNPTISKTFTYYFYRPGFSTPLITFDMEDSTFRKVNYETFDKNNLTINGIEELKNGLSNAYLYPNPVNTSAVNLKFNETNGVNYMLHITNSLGQTIQTVYFSGTQGKTGIQVNLAPEMANGLYFYTIEGAENMISEKFILNR